MQPHAFVVMPFGLKEARPASTKPARPAVEVDFDVVYKALVGPALAHAGCVPFRADQQEAAGDIRTDMFYELVTADVVVADISVLNPNVFYELGIRHGVAASGVFMIHGGWSKRPFDVAPDRTFDYDGTLFSVAKNKRNKAWTQKVAAEAARLGSVLQAALRTDAQTIGSPVYKEMVGLVPADIRGIKTARANYFGSLFVDWKARVQVAKLNGQAGDILTLADDAPTRLHCVELLWEAADALFSMERFEAALPVLESLVALAPGHRNGQTRLGLVLARLGKVHEARVHMQAVAEKFQLDPEAHGILGRTYKDLWRLEWCEQPTLLDRQRRAVAASHLIATAVRVYDQAARRKFDYYTGINVVSFVRLLAHLRDVTGEPAADHGVADVDVFASVVRFAATNTLAEVGLAARDQEGAWAAATLGELELVAGNAAAAAKHYGEAVYTPQTTYFQVNSMLEQVYLFEQLGFQPEAVDKVKTILEARRATIEERIGGLKKSAPRFTKVFVCSGHMIDAPERPQERFPPRQEKAVQAWMKKQLDEWKIGDGHLAICGGARGADLLFAELCAQSGAEVWLMLPLPEAKFLDQSVRLAGTDWVDRFYRVKERRGVRVFLQEDRLKAPPAGADVFARNNLWMLNTARVEVDDAKNLYALLVWDGKSTGDGPGGTSDFVARVAALGGHRECVDPLQA